MVGEGILGTQGLEEDEVGQARSGLERVRYVDDRVARSELHTRISAVGKPDRLAGGRELLATVNHTHQLVRTQ